jgi:hypothetical protein
VIPKDTSDVCLEETQQNTNGSNVDKSFGMFPGKVVFIFSFSQHIHTGLGLFDVPTQNQKRQGSRIELSGKPAGRQCGFKSVSSFFFLSFSFLSSFSPLPLLPV